MNKDPMDRRKFLRLFGFGAGAVGTAAVVGPETLMAAAGVAAVAAPEQTRAVIDEAMLRLGEGGFIHLGDGGYIGNITVVGDGRDVPAVRVRGQGSIVEGVLIRDH